MKPWWTCQRVSQCVALRSTRQVEKEGEKKDFLMLLGPEHKVAQKASRNPCLFFLQMTESCLWEGVLGPQHAPKITHIRKLAYPDENVHTWALQNILPKTSLKWQKKIVSPDARVTKWQSMGWSSVYHNKVSRIHAQNLSFRVNEFKCSNFEQVWLK